MKPVDSLFIVDSTTGFQYPLDGGEFDDVFLVPREHVIKEAYQPDHAKLLHALAELSKKTRQEGIKRGKDRIVAFQEGSNNKYLTPGIFPLRTSCGMGIRGVGDLEHSDHDAIYKYVKKSESLALSYMGKEMKRGFSHAKQAFPYETFPGVKKGQKTHMFSAIATSLNVCLNSHKDTDAVYSVVTNLEANPEKRFKLDDEITCYFTFPTLGFAVALRPGDILYFNATIYHSVSSRCDPTKNIWCTSLYTKNAVVGGNGNLLPLTKEQIMVIDPRKDTCNT